jgi:Cu+-exporting ATPase
MVKKVFKIIDMHCTSCAMTIDGDLEDTGHVKSSKTNYAKAQTEVEFDPAKITEEEIFEVIKKAGYTAQPL